MSSPTHRPARRFRRRSALALVATAGLLLASCGEPPKTSGAGGGRQTSEDEEAGSGLPECPLEALEAAEGPVKVNLWFGGIVDPPLSVLTELIADFNASQDKVVVTADNQGTAYEEVQRKYEGAAGTPDQLPDMIYLEDTSLGTMVDRGQVLPAQSCMEASDFDMTSITPAVRASYSADGVLYPAYMNVSSPVIFYNKVHFEKAGLDPNTPPKTLDEMFEMAQVIQDKGVAPKPISFVANEWFVNTWMAGIGQEAVNNQNGRKAPATEATFNTPEVVEIFTKLRDGANGPKPLINAFAKTEGSIDHYLAMVQGTSSMLVETSTASGTIAQVLGGDLSAADAANFDTSNLNLDLSGIVPGSGELPGIKAPGKIYASGGAFYILNTGSPAEQAASWKFFEFMFQPENVKKWHVEGGYLPLTEEVIDDPEVAEFQATDLAGLLLAPAVSQLATANPDRPSPLIAPMTQYQDITQAALEAVLFNGADPAKTVEKAEADVTKALQDYNAD